MDDKVAQARGPKILPNDDNVAGMASKKLHDFAPTT